MPMWFDSQFVIAFAMICIYLLFCYSVPRMYRIEVNTMIIDYG